MMSLRKLVFTLTMTILILVTLFLPCVKADVQLASEFVEPVKNWSFEDRDMPDPYIPNDGVYRCPPWETNKPIGTEGGWRELRGDCRPPYALVDIFDYMAVAGAFGSQPDDPNWDPDADLNGDAIVDIFDITIVVEDFGKSANRIDDYYSWYTSGGGDYQMWQWLDSDVVMALAGEKVKFSFYFYPESVAPDGSQNNARVEIYYEYAGGYNIVNGSWVAPTELDWWNAYVTANLPSTIYYVAVIIHGKPDFKAWVDLAQLTTPDYNLYYTYPPYENQGAYPPSGTCRVWPDAKICAYGNKSTGEASAYSQDASVIGAGKEAYVQFNRNPPPGNSPQVYQYQEEDGFYIGAYWVTYGYLGTVGLSISTVSIVLYLYYLRLGHGWEYVTTYVWTFDSLTYPNQAIYYQGSVSQWIPSPPSGSGCYTVVARTRTYAGTDDGSAKADFLFPPYFMYVDYIKMSD